ncbi:MAG: GntR family transcriptional regulator [Lachnospiraceae bacterium]|nr:GntR family transcriptional regulator [Lachnospiraceae bacterium]
MKSSEKRSRAEEVAAFLRRKIFDGELQAGERLIEADIAKELEMSRGPVRDALLVLEYEGLVTAKPNKGCTVTRLSGEDAYEIFYLRGMLETEALKKCGGKLPDSSIFLMKNIIDEMKEAGNLDQSFERLLDCDERFHSEILKSSKMERLYRLWKTMSPLNGAMFLKVRQSYEFQDEAVRRKFEKPYSRRETWEYHLEMLEILEKGNLEESIKIVNHHYCATGERICRWEKRKEQMNRGIKYLE